MKNDGAAKIAGWFFIAAAVLFWGGWMLLHVHIGPYFEPDIFPAVKKHLAYWISMYRMHIFGIVLSALAITSFASLFTESPARVLIWPGAACAAGGMFVWAAAAAFYYHFGAWGGLVYGDTSVAERQALVDSLLLNTEYACCLVRFGHVFSGLGLCVIGLVAMAVTMGLPEYPQYYVPVFHAFPLWLAGMGAVLIKSGLRGSHAI